MKDIILDSDGDLKIKNGDIVTGEAAFQSMVDLIESNEGEFKVDLLAGVGATKYISGNAARLENKIRSQLKRLGLRLSLLKITKDPGGQFKVFIK